MMENRSRFVVVIMILLALGFISILTAAVLSFAFHMDDLRIDGNVAVIPVKGVIMTGSPGGFMDSATASSTTIVEWIKKADKNPDVEAIIIEIDSPGGTPVGSDEISMALKEANKTTVAVIREVGASGAYWVASSCDHIFANRMSVTGSIGVRGSYLDYSGLLKRYNVTYQELYAGEYKEAGSPFRKLTEKERQNIMSQINDLHDIFISEVAENRRMEESLVRSYATGETFLGFKAKEIGLIDSLGGMDEAVAYIEGNLNITAKVYRFERPARLSDIIWGYSGDFSRNIGKGIGESIVQDSSGRPMLD